MVIAEEEVKDHFRKLKIKDDTGYVVKLDVFCNPKGFDEADKSIVYTGLLGGSRVDVYRVRFSGDVEGIVICMENDCKLIDLILFGRDGVDLHDVCGDVR